MVALRLFSSYKQEERVIEKFQKELSKNDMFYMIKE